jgi:hypothetical protein
MEFHYSLQATPYPAHAAFLNASMRGAFCVATLFTSRPINFPFFSSTKSTSSFVVASSERYSLHSIGGSQDARQSQLPHQPKQMRLEYPVCPESAR